MKRSILIPIDPEPEEPSRDLEQELKEAQAKIKQLESVLHYGVEMGKMVPRFEYMVLEAKVEEANSNRRKPKKNSKQPFMMVELPDGLRFMEPFAERRYEELSSAYWDVREENRALKRVLRNLRETAQQLRVPIDEELLEY